MKTALPGARPGAAEAEALIQEARRRQRRRHLLIGMAAVVALAVVAGVLVSRSGSAGRPLPTAGRVPLAGPPARYGSLPAYYAYAVQGDVYNYVSHGTQYSMGVPGRYLKVRATASGKLLATISPPGRYNDFSLLTADASGRTFVFGAMRFWEHNAGPSPRLFARDQVTPFRFTLLRIIAGGRRELLGLRLPEGLVQAQHPSIALSPDGTRLAVAFGGDGHTAVVQVVSLATGRSRQWLLPHSLWTPVLSGEGAWTADGHTLMFQQRVILRGRPVAASARHGLPTTTPVRLLSTDAAGSSLAAARLLVVHPPAGRSAPVSLFITPDGSKLIGAAGPPRPRNWRAARWQGELAVYSARTGGLLRTLAPWVWRWPSPPGRGGVPSQAVVWSSRTGSQLVVLQPRDDLNVLGVLTGNTVTVPGRLLPQPTGYRVYGQRR